MWGLVRPGDSSIVIETHKHYISQVNEIGDHGCVMNIRGIFILYSSACLIVVAAELSIEMYEVLIRS